MAPFPLDLTAIFGHWESYIFYVIIGFGFGYVLEIAGFGYSPKLAAQFYFKDLTVLKVMFTAIVVAMVGIFVTSALGLLDYNLVWVNPTYLWPGIVGGLIMGAGFIIGGFCPGTSLVAAATLKLDGIFFALGAFFGIFLFGETVSFFEDFWYSSYMGRYTIQDMLGVDAGVVVLVVVVMAIMIFFGAEQLERIFGGKDPKSAPKWRYGAAGGLVVLGIVALVIGQPTTEDKWNRLAADKQAELDARTVQIHPAELLGLMHDNRVITRVLDVRNEADFNSFHILDSEHVPLAELPSIIKSIQNVPANTVFIIASNDETAATDAWKTLVAESVQNVYILEGGINNWLTTFSEEAFKTQNMLVEHGQDMMAYAFPVALGSRFPAADPNKDVFENVEFTPKVVLKSKRGATGGGCG